MRCSYCHDRLSSSEATRCGDCGAELHLECWTEARGCTTLGCTTRLAPAPRPATGTRPGPGPIAVHPLALVALAAVLTCILGGAAWDGWSRAAEQRARDEAQQVAESARRRADDAARERESDRLCWELRSMTRASEPAPAEPAVEPAVVASPPAGDTHLVYGPPIPR